MCTTTRSVACIVYGLFLYLRSRTAGLEPQFCRPHVLYFAVLFVVRLAEEQRTWSEERAAGLVKVLNDKERGEVFDASGLEVPGMHAVVFSALAKAVQALWGVETDEIPGRRDNDDRALGRKLVEEVLAEIELPAVPLEESQATIISGAASGPSTPPPPSAAAPPAAAGVGAAAVLSGSVPPPSVAAAAPVAPPAAATPVAAAAAAGVGVAAAAAGTHVAQGQSETPEEQDDTGGGDDSQQTILLSAGDGVPGGMCFEAPGQDPGGDGPTPRDRRSGSAAGEVDTVVMRTIMSSAPELKYLSNPIDGLLYSCPQGAESEEAMWSVLRSVVCATGWEISPIILVVVLSEQERGLEELDAPVKREEGKNGAIVLVGVGLLYIYFIFYFF